MNIHFESLKKSRKLIINILKNLDLNKLNTIPSNFKNNIIWNIGHLVVTQQLLCYRNSGLNCLVSDQLIDKYKKGTSPEKEVTEQEFQHLVDLFLKLPKTLEEDYKKGLFVGYSSYTTSVNVTLNSIDDAVAFNLYHEGIHLGIILQLIKLI